MWAFPAPADEPKFLIIARSDRRPIPEERLPAELRERLILYGALSTLDDGRPVGVALAVQAPDRDAVGSLLDGFQEIEIHDWEFGGRR